jgi:hypothetical protein
MQEKKKYKYNVKKIKNFIYLNIIFSINFAIIILFSLLLII